MSRIFNKLNVGDNSNPAKPGSYIHLVPADEAIPRILPEPKKKTFTFPIHLVKIGFRILLLIAFITTTAGALNYLSQHHFKKQAPPLIEAPKTDPTLPVVNKREIDEKTHQDAIDLYRKKEYVEALAKFETLLASYPKSAALKNNLGLSYLKLNDFKKAEIKFKEALKIDSRDAATYNNLGSLKMAEFKLDEAILYLSQATLFQPNLVEAHLNLAKTFELKGNPMEAIPEYQDYLDLTSSGGDFTLRGLIEKRIAKLKTYTETAHASQDDEEDDN